MSKNLSDEVLLNSLESQNGNEYDFAANGSPFAVGAAPGLPPDKPDGGGEGGGSKDTTALTGVLQLDSGTKSYDGGEEGATLSSTTSDENVVLAQNGASLTISHYTLNKSGDCSSEDNSNFYAVNAVAAAKSAAKIYIDNSVLNSNAEGANGLFASGEGSTIYAYNCTITSTKNSSRGLDATYEGTVIASKLTINTSGDHCAALATDRGDGYISVTDSTLTTAGQGSPLIYSTGIIEVNNVAGTSTGSQVAGIEGLSTIRIKNSILSGSGKKASEPVANGVIIYQSMSGDSTEGTATFEVVGSTLTSAINGGAMFYITNTEAVITVQNTILDFDSSSNYLLKAAGNDGSNGWGTAGANGAEVVFTAIDQTLTGTVSVDRISSLDMYLINSAYTGTFEIDTTYTGDGGTDLYIDADSTWTVTENCTLQNLTAAAGAKILDSDGKTVSIVKSGETVVSGTSDLTITVSAYTSATVEALYTINDFEIDRTAFEEMYSEEETETKYDDRIVVAGTSMSLQEGKTYTAVPYEGNGGAVYVEASGTVTGENVTFKDNSVTDNSGQGGAIYNDSGAMLNITSAAFIGNNTTGLKGQGGAIYNGGTATVTETTFSDNSATMGGAVFNNGGSLKLIGGTMSGNSAKYGGAIQNFKGGTVNITDVVFSGNTAGADGGAIAHNSGSATITGTTFNGNAARSSGGAIWNTSTLTLADVIFSGNSAKSSGGAIYNDGGTVNLTGIVTLAAKSDDFYNTGTLNWDLTGGNASYSSLAGYQYLNNDGGMLTITVDDNQGIGSYAIATGDFSSLDGKGTFTLTGIDGQSTITINGESVLYNDMRYTLATNDNGTTENLTDDKLVLTVESQKTPIVDAAITVDGTYTYNGKAQEAAVTVKLDGITLVKDADYTLTYANNIDAGTATVTVTGIGLYTGTKDAAFTINRKELTVIGSAADGKIYDGTKEAKIGTIGVLSGAAEGDDVAIDAATGEFDSTDAGNGKDVLITYTLTGEDALNYSVLPGTTCADIEKRSVTLTSADDAKVYDGTPLTNHTVTVSGDGFVSGEGAAYNVTGSQTEVGSSANTFTYTLNEGTKAGNYVISTEEGTLTVNSDYTNITLNNRTVTVTEALNNESITFVNNGVLNAEEASVHTKRLSVTGTGNRILGDEVSADTFSMDSGSELAMGREVFDSLMKTKKMARDVQGTLILEDAGNQDDLKVEAPQILFLSGLEGIQKAELKNERTYAFTKGTGTAKNDTVTIAKGAEITFGAKGGTFDMLTGTNTLSVKAKATANFLGTVNNLSKLTADAGAAGDATEVSAETLNFSENTGGTLNLGKYAALTADTITGTTKADKITFGANNTVNVNTLQLGGGANTVSVGAGAVLTSNVLSGEIQKMTLSNGSVLELGSGITGTAKADTLSFGNDVKAIVGDWNSAGGNDKLTIGKNSNLTMGALNLTGSSSVTLGSYSHAELGPITGINKLTVSAGKDGDLTVADINGSVTGTAKADTLSLGNYTKTTITGDVVLYDGNDKVSVGKGTEFTAGALDLGAGNNTVSFGAASEVHTGKISGVNKLTVTAGKDGDLTVADIAGDITGTAKADTFSFGNYTDVNIHGTVSFEGKDKVSVGKSSTLVLKSADATGLKSLTLGKGSEAYLSTELCGIVAKGKGFTVHDIGSAADGVAQAFTDLKSEKGDDTDARTISGSYNGWLNSTLDKVDLVTIGSQTSLTAVDSNDLTVSCGSEVLSFSEGRIDLTNYAGSTLKIELASGADKSILYQIA